MILVHVAVDASIKCATANNTKNPCKIRVLCQIVLVDNNLIQGIDTIEDDFYHPFIMPEIKKILAMK